MHFKETEIMWERNKKWKYKGYHLPGPEVRSERERQRETSPLDETMEEVCIQWTVEFPDEQEIEGVFKSRLMKTRLLTGPPQISRCSGPWNPLGVF